MWGNDASEVQRLRSEVEEKQKALIEHNKTVTDEIRLVAPGSTVCE